MLRLFLADGGVATLQPCSSACLTAELFSLLVVMLGRQDRVSRVRFLLGLEDETSRDPLGEASVRRVERLCVGVSMGFEYAYCFSRDLKSPAV